MAAAIEVDDNSASTLDFHLAGCLHAKKQRGDAKPVFAPGKYVFNGKPGGEGDPGNYTVKYTAATENAGPLRVITPGPRVLPGWPFRRR